MGENYMEDSIKVLCHSSIRIAGEKVLYFDPFEVKNEPHDADYIFVTHEHYDHFSPEDIKKVMKDGTVIVAPASIKYNVDADGFPNVVYMETAETRGLGSLTVETVPSYNPDKRFHPRAKGYVGYIVTMGGTRYYVAGDTDITPEAEAVRCDVALVPAGGKFTMDAEDAAELVNIIKPRLAIPTHYGRVTGELTDGQIFADHVDPGIEVLVMIE